MVYDGFSPPFRFCLWMRCKRSLFFPAAITQSITGQPQPCHFHVRFLSRLLPSERPPVMAHQDSTTHIPDVHSITLDYIANQLPSYDPMFRHPPLHLDPVSGRHVPNSQAMAAALKARPGADDCSLMVAAPTTAWDDNGLPPRPAWTEIKDMAFWNSIFIAAIATFRETTKPVSGRSKTLYDIRTKNDWDAVYDTLVAARDKYQEEGGPVGWLRKVRRKVADNISPAVHASKIASKIAPNDLIATPVLGAVEVMLDVRHGPKPQGTPTRARAC